MNRTVRLSRWPAFGLLAVALVVMPVATAKPQTKVSTTTTKADQDKQIADIEKQIADLQKKLDDMKTGSKSPEVAIGTIPDSYAKKMTWRPIGPANMGGRITAIAVNEADPTTYYVATASGGLLKTVNNGTTFTHTFDDQPTVSIGDVAVAPSKPDIVWVGTGEANPRNSVSYGDGVYKSTDGGKTWANMGLKKSFQIGKIVIHPKNPDVVYVGALGRLYGPNEERGLFKTEDGGKTWKKVLYIDDKTGIIDLRMDPNDPETLIAAAWERKRNEFDTEYGPSSSWPSPDQYGPAVTYGPGGGLFKSTDGGKTWKKLTDEKAKSGLPTVKTGRIGLDYSAKTKGLVYAIIDTENVGMGPARLQVQVGISSEPDDAGLKVGELTEGGPAEKAGVKVNDVIVKIDDTAVKTYDDFLKALKDKKAGDTAKFTVKRDGKELTLELKLTARPAEGGGGPGGGPGGGQGLAVLMPGFTPQVTFNEAVKVGSVPAGGPAEKAGVKAGMEVVSIDGRAIADGRELITEMRTTTKKAGEKVKVEFKQGEKKLEVELALAETTLQIGGGGGGGGGRPGGAANRPYISDGTVGGQRGNVQADQGKDGFQTGGVFMSKDNGDTWTRVNSLNPRPMYFSVVRVDPTDDKRIYVLGDTSLWQSTDGGARFATAAAREVHPDHHALWINPKDGRHMLIGCDGGFYVTYDRGNLWDHLNILALGQFYHVAADNRKPYRVYGGLQDNGSWGGPSHVLRPTGPVNEDWVYVNGGDGFVMRVDPTDPDLVYFESQGGAIGRRNFRTGERGFIRRPPAPVAGEPFRFNWNTPFILSAANPSIFYTGAQYVIRSVNRGDTCKVISPELTRSKAGTISAIAESPRNPDVLWAGTDDGNVWVTKDGGTKWANVTGKFKTSELPGPRWVASLEPSKTKDGMCYACFDAHRSDDDKPYLFVTEDYGETWKSVNGNLPAFGSTRVLREDTVNPNLLYCGTEFGICVSVNAGKSWTRINNNLPTVAVHEVAQPTTASEIVVATHGRSLWVLDVASLRQMTPESLKAAATLYAPGVATRWKADAGGVFPYSRNVRKFYGVNPANGVSLDYTLTAAAKDVSLKVVDVTGKAVRDFRGGTGKEVGFHRVQWDLTGTAGAGGAGGRPGGGGGGGPGGGRPGGGGFGASVPAGMYRVVLTVDGKEFVQSVVVENDPNADPKAFITPITDDQDDADGENTEIKPFIPRIRD